MLRTTLARGIALGSPRVGLSRACNSSLVLGVARISTSTKPIENAKVTKKSGAGLEGPHPNDSLQENLPVSSKDDNSHNHIRGDWVLFHPVYTEEHLQSVKVMHREAKTFSDKFASMLVQIMRRGFDILSRYKHKPLPPNADKMSIQELRKGGYIMDDHQWLGRILFLESIAAVPGMVASTLRHLRSLRLMRRDMGWIHTLLEEAENERMHLMTFMTIRHPSIFFRALVLGAQGVFYNVFFFSYLISPRTCHRFVGHLEEEAVVTYTRCLEEIEAGRIPEWSNYPAPEIAKDYWRLAPDAKLLDVIYAVRSDESTHRFVNHSFANLDHNSDINPFAMREPDMIVKGTKLEFKRPEAEAFAKESMKLVEQKKK